MSVFLDPSDVAILTGKKIKSCQIDELRRMGIAFFINSSGRPVVPKASIDGSNKPAEQPESTWVPNVLLNHGQKTN